MSDATERPADAADTADADADAWAKACAEDLAAEQERRGARYGEPQPGSAAEELRKLADAVADKLSSLQAPMAGTPAGMAVQQLIAQAKAVVEPVVERNPDVFGHLAAAGNELLAAYRAAVEGQERRWTGPEAEIPRLEDPRLEDPGRKRDAGSVESAGSTGSEGSAGSAGSEGSGGSAGPDARKPGGRGSGGRGPDGPDGTGSEHIDLD